MVAFPSQNPVTVTNADGSTGVTYDQWYCSVFIRHMNNNIASLSATFQRCFVDTNGNINSCPPAVSPPVPVFVPNIANDAVLGPAVASAFAAWVTELMTAGTLT